MRTNTGIIEDIYDEYSRKLYIAAYRILGNSQEAEDVMQDTILKVCSQKNLDKIDNLGAYLSRGSFGTSYIAKWRRKYHCKLKLVESSSNSILQYEFLNSKEEVLD